MLFLIVRLQDSVIACLQLEVVIVFIRVRVPHLQRTGRVLEETPNFQPDIRCIRFVEKAGRWQSELLIGAKPGEGSIDLHTVRPSAYLCDFGVVEGLHLRVQLKAANDCFFGIGVLEAACIQALSPLVRGKKQALPYGVLALSSVLFPANRASQFFGLQA